MQFLADESCDFAIVRALRASGHDVLAVAELTPQAEDDEVIQSGHRERRIVISEDKGFGELVYAKLRACPGVILVRYPSAVRENVARSVVQLVEREGNDLIGAFIVVKPGRVRVRRPPTL